MQNREEQPVQQTQPLVADINLTRGLWALLALVLVAVACLSTLAWGQKEAAADTQAAPAAVAGMRKYYMTQLAFDGDEVLTACAPGYHMASLWEILDPSNLEYNSGLGLTRADSGAGPLMYTHGRVRTGWDSSVTGGAGYDNCSAWTTDAGSAKGTTAWLDPRWTGDFEEMHVWSVGTAECSEVTPVWCVED